MEFGLPPKTINLLRETFGRIPEIEAVYLYGSRAKGTYKRRSDIDLAVHFKKNGKSAMGKLKRELDELPIILKIDVLDDTKITKKAFRDEYEQTKKLFFKL